MPDPGADGVRWSYASASGRGWIEADLSRATITWRRDSEERRALDADSVGQLRELAAAVRSEDAARQPTDITYACDEQLEIRLADQRVAIDVWSGEIAVGAPGALVERLRALVASLADR